MNLNYQSKRNVSMQRRPSLFLIKITHHTEVEEEEVISEVEAEEVIFQEVLVELL